jgi:hypothetical protein
MADAMGEVGDLVTSSTAELIPNRAHYIEAVGHPFSETLAALDNFGSCDPSGDAGG